MKKVVLSDIRKQDYYYSEAIKTLRTNIQFSGNDMKTILLTSCYPNEGKSDIAFSLAKELGEIGKKTLLLDADIRKSAYMGRFRVKQEVNGLTQYLSGQIGAGEILYATNYPGMHIIFAGRSAPNPSGLLGGRAFLSLMTELRNFYDYILVDTPPIGTIIDAAVVAAHVDGAILVVESEAVSYRVAQRAMDQLRMSGCEVIGGVLNKVDTKKDKYYSHYYSRYGSYYQKSEQTQKTE